MVTGSGNVALAAEAVENGAAAFVRKPFDLGHLDRLVTEILAKSGRWRPEDIRKAYRVLQAIFGKAS